MEVNDLPCPLYAVLVAIREILHVECDNDQTEADYRSPLMTIFKNIRDISEYCAKLLKFPQSVIGDVEKNIYPRRFFFRNWSARICVKTLSENTKWRHEILCFNINILIGEGVQPETQAVSVSGFIFKICKIFGFPDILRANVNYN